MSSIVENIEQTVLAYRHIGILVSGGFDSALLTYLIYDARDKLKTDNEIEFFTVPRFDNSAEHAARIKRFIENTFDLPLIMHSLVGDPTLDHALQVSSGIRSIISKYAYLDVLLTGENITPAELVGGPIRIKGINKKLYKPFFDFTKDNMIQLCIDKGLIEIMKISHTCTESTTLRCNVCWQCRERAWAFRQCNYTDPGIM